MCSLDGNSLSTASISTASRFGLRLRSCSSDLETLALLCWSTVSARDRFFGVSFSTLLGCHSCEHFGAHTHAITHRPPFVASSSSEVYQFPSVKRSWHISFHTTSPGVPPKRRSSGPTSSKKSRRSQSASGSRCSSPSFSLQALSSPRSHSSQHNGASMAAAGPLSSLLRKCYSFTG